MYNFLENDDVDVENNLSVASDMLGLRVLGPNQIRFRSFILSDLNCDIRQLNMP